MQIDHTISSSSKDIIKSIGDLLGSPGQDAWVQQIVLALGGFIIGLIAKRLTNSINYFRQYSSGNKVLGSKYMYHFSKDQSTIFVQQKILLERGFLRYRATVCEMKDEQWQKVYSGTGRIEGDSFIFNLKSTTETCVIRFEKIHHRIQPTFGIWSGIDFGNRVFATAFLIIQDELKGNDEEKKKQFRYLIDPAICTIPDRYAVSLKTKD